MLRLTFLLVLALDLTAQPQHVDTATTGPGKVLTLTYNTGSRCDSVVYLPETKGKKIFIPKGNGNTGNWILFDQAGYKIGEYTVHNKLWNGLSITYNRAGKIVVKEFFVEGQREGEALYYYGNGTLKQKVEFIHDKADGWMKSYYPNGSVKWTGKYRKGHLDGERVAYDEQGNLVNGDHTFFHENGRIDRQGTFIEGRPQGEVRIYDADGKLTQVINFENGKPHGEVIHYRDGCLLSIEIYRKGHFKKRVKVKKKK